MTGNGPQDKLPLDRALVFRDDHQGVLLIRLDSRGACLPDPSIPTFWVTAPTRSGHAAGFAVNGQFRLDIGRTQLAKSHDGAPVEENVLTCRRLGQAVGGAMIELFDATKEEWDGVREQLGLLRDVSPKDFWRSVWDVLATTEAVADPLLHALLWEDRAVLRQLIAQRPAMPTGLAGEHDVLTRLDDVRAKLSGVLDDDDVAFTQLAAWPAFRRRWPVGTIVSDRRIAKLVSKAFPDVANSTSAVWLLDAIQDETTEVGVSAETAALLATVVTRDALREWESRGGKLVDECQNIRAYLADLRFQSASGDWAAARELVVGPTSGAGKGSVDKDELHRASFAPSDRVLNPAYRGPALEFFLASRVELNAPATLMAEWLLAARTPDARAAALRYLLKGDLGQQVAGEIRDRRAGAWIEELNLGHLAEYGFDEREQVEILALVGTSRAKFVEILGVRRR